MVSQTSARNKKNIWVAAGDGDLERVQELIEEGVSPNATDENSYTPMHAAASYAQIQVLDYLISKRGDVNLTDEDGETPLFVVETVEVARYLVEKGATPGWQNQEGETPADKLEADFPEISAYLRSLAGPVAGSDPMAAARTQQPSQYATEQTAEQLTSGLIAEVQTIMEQAEREGKDPQEDLQRVVGDALLASARAGQGLGGSASQENDEDEIKRTRLNGNDS